MEWVSITVGVVDLSGRKKVNHSEYNPIQRGKSCCKDSFLYSSLSGKREKVPVPIADGDSHIGPG